MSDTLQIGAVVIDRDQTPIRRDEFEDKLAVVLSERVETAENATIDGLSGKTVADVNPDYDRNGAVYTIAFIDALERKVTGWRTWDRTAAEDYRDGLMWALERDSDDWRDPIRRYDYPVGRLKRVGILNPDSKSETSGMRIDRDAMLETFPDD